MTKHYFGTDGIRGTFGQEPITEGFMKPLSYALSHYLEKKADKPIVVIGQDPRASGKILAQELSALLSSQGVVVHLIGIVPTAAVPICLLKAQATLGIAITASHNPAADNGLKFFNEKGYKLSSKEEDILEAFINRHPDNKDVDAAQVMSIDGKKAYLDFITAQFERLDLKNWTIAIDTAHGATAHTTPTLLTAWGAQVFCIGNEPNGTNINEHVGSEYPEKIQSLVLQKNATFGLAHDGDGDRVIFCDETGAIVDGDEILGILALHLKSENKLNQHTLITTIQSNTGLEKSLIAKNINLERTAVGDRNVLYTMLEKECPLGGENSGHIIFKDILPAGDGLIAALHIVQIMIKTGKPLSVLRQNIELFPQVTDTLEVKEKRPLNELKYLPQAIGALKDKLGSDGRVLVRYSGTEPKLRFLVEGPVKTIIQEEMQILKAAAKRDLDSFL